MPNFRDGGNISKKIDSPFTLFKDSENTSSKSSTCSASCKDKADCRRRRGSCKYLFSSSSSLYSASIESFMPPSDFN